MQKTQSDIYDLLLDVEIRALPRRLPPSPVRIREGSDHDNA